MASIPTRLFDVRNGNDAADKDKTVYPAATLIVFRDVAAKAKIVQSFCDAYGYQATIDGAPNPQPKAAFYTQKITEFIKDVHRGTEIKIDVDLATTAAKMRVDGELPEIR